MLVALSDIHFVDGTAGEHNLPYSAFESVFLVDVASLAVDKQAKELKVLLVGDIVDLIRSTKWLDIDPQDRPWGDRGLADIPSPRKGSETEKQCLKILGKVSPKSLEKPEAPVSLASFASCCVAVMFKARANSGFSRLISGRRSAAA